MCVLEQALGGRCTQVDLGVWSDWLSSGRAGGGDVCTIAHSHVRECARVQPSLRQNRPGETDMDQAQKSTEANS